MLFVFIVHEFYMTDIEIDREIERNRERKHTCIRAYTIT
jgi:hypothetical protein